MEKFDRAAAAIPAGKYILAQTNILIVTHNGTGRMLRTVVEDGKPLELYKQPRLENAVIYKLADI